MTEILGHETSVRTIAVKRRTLGKILSFRIQVCDALFLAVTVKLSTGLFSERDKNSIQAALVTSSRVGYYSNINVLSLRTSLREPILSLECQYLSLCR